MDHAHNVEMEILEHFAEFKLMQEDQQSQQHFLVIIAVLESLIC
jgi:hypothetical protein